MKCVYILFIFNLLQVPMIFCQSRAEVDRLLQECAQELNIDLQLYEGNLLEKNICIQACVGRKSVIEDLIGKNNKETNYNLFSKMIDAAYKAGFESTKFTRQDVVNKVENCYATESNECEFVKCLDPLYPPINDVLIYLGRNNIENTIFKIQ